MFRGKKYKDNAKLIDRATQYEVPAAMDLVVKTASAKFDETVELHVKLGVDSRHADQQVRGAIVLPNGTGKTARVLVFAKGDKADAAREAGADFVGDMDLVQKIQQEIRQHLDEKAQLYGNRVEELTGRLMNGLEKASDEYLQERVLRLAQLRSGADMFERRLLRSHPNLRSKRHGSKLIDLLRQKKDGVVKK